MLYIVVEVLHTGILLYSQSGADPESFGGGI